MVRHRGQFHSDPADIAVKMHKCDFCDFRSFRKDKVTRHTQRKHLSAVLGSIAASSSNRHPQQQSFVNPAHKHVSL